MARISDTDLTHLKRDISLERLVEAKGIELKRHGKDLIGLCPFHADKEPSLVVTPNKNLWHCLGACQQGGSVIDWVMKAEGVSFRHAVELLRNDAPSLAAPLSALPGGRPAKGERKLAPVLSRDADDQRLLLQVIDYYHATLKESPEALAYLDERGLRSSEVVEHFKLGYANRTLGYRLPVRARADGAELRGRLQKLGLLRASGHEHLRGSLVIPIFDEAGAVAEVYGRKINDRVRKGTPLHLYLPGPHRGIFNVEALAASEEVILCEALIDALTFWCAGFRNVTSAYGVEGFTQDHLEAFAKHGTKRVLIAYDRDEAGERAAEKLGELLIARGIECFRINFPKGMDANSYALKVTPAQKSLEAALRGAVWMGKGPAPSVTVPAVPAPAMASTSEPRPESAVSAVPPLVTPPGAPTAPEASPSLAAERTREVTASSPSSPPASLVPQPPADITTQEQLAQHDEDKDEVTLIIGNRRWRIRGLQKNTSYDTLRVNVLCARGDSVHVDTFDLYSAKHRASFIAFTATELGINEEVIKKDLGRVLFALEKLQDQRIQALLTPRDEQPVMSEQARADAMALLRAPDLLDRILADFEACGVVGEETNKLAGYLAAISRKLTKPLGVIIQSSSAAGKSALMDAILAFVPPEDRVRYSAMTGQALFYMGEQNLAHKVLAIVEEEGAARASYALKLLQSEGELIIASTGKDPQTGKLVTHEYRVKGPVMIFLTTTAVEIDEELLNRCLVLAVDEGLEQTRAIHRRQRAAETLVGLRAQRERDRLIELHQNAQRLLRPLWVVNPFAEDLTFLDDLTRTRRDQPKYLSLIRSIALLHQHQRPLRTLEESGTGELLEYVEVTREDIALANRLTGPVLLRSRDELPPQTRRLLLLIDAMTSERCEAEGIERSAFRFSRREVREHTGWSQTQVRVHLERLVALEYLLVHRGGRGQSFVYELCWSRANEVSATLGLADASQIGPKDATTTTNLAGGGGAVSGGWRGAILGENPSDHGPLRETWRGGGKSTLGKKKRPAAVTVVAR